MRIQARRTIIVSIIVLLILCIFSGCKKCEHVYSPQITKEATVNDVGVMTYTCSICGDTYTEEIPKIKSSWAKNYYVDEFGDKTNESYIYGSFNGTYSTSTSSGKSLEVFVYIEDLNKVSFRLLELGSYKPVFTNSDKTVTMKVKMTTGSVKEYELYPSPATSDLYFLYSEDRSEFYQAVSSSDSLSCTILTKYNTYYFKTNNIGLSELYKVGQ